MFGPILATVLAGQSDNVTVMEGMNATLFCDFKSDLGVHVSWVRPSKKAIESKMTAFDPKDPDSYELVLDPKTGQQVAGSSLTIEETKLSDSGLYFCVGQVSIA
jgi:hypothetical protein